MSTHNGIIIRPARAGDESEVANVHINSWREAYRNMLPAEFLDDLPLSFRRRKGWWSEVIATPDKHILLLAENKNSLVGFGCFHAGRDPGMENYAEIAAMYLFNKFKGHGIGTDLLKKGLSAMQARGFSKAYCWVLVGNPAIQFYEHLGGKFLGRSKEDVIGGQRVKEICLEWERIGT